MRKNYAKGLRSLLCFLIFILSGIAACFGQKYTFSQYNISDGLIQSQVNVLCQGADQSLWVGTYGGASHFNGKEFTSYTRANGLPNDFIYAVFTDRGGTTWFGTQNGIANISNGKIAIYKLPQHLVRTPVTSIVQDHDGVIWFLMDNMLYKISGEKIKPQLIQDTIKQPVSCLTVSRDGKLYAWVYPRGLYCLDGSKWQQVIPDTDRFLVIRKMIFDKADPGRFYLMSDKDLFYNDGNKMQPYLNKLTQTINSRFLSMEVDGSGDLWLGTNNGAYRIKNNLLTHFTVNNGFTDKAVSSIYCDADKNLWFATQGNGFYKYEGDDFVIFDKSQGLPDDHIIFGITKDNAGSIILGLDGGGLIRFNNNKLTVIPLPRDKPALQQVQCLHTDKKGALWIGTEIGGLWKSDRGGFTMIAGSERLSINSIIEDDAGTIWAATPYGCFYVDGNKFIHIAGSDAFAFSILPVTKDSVFIGTHDGLTLSVNKKIVSGFHLDAVKNLSVICMIRYGRKIIMGTDDNGVYIWDPVNGKLKNFNIKDGLNSNAIYAVVADENGTVWMGTGRGVNKLLFNKKQNTFTVNRLKNANEPIFEADQSGALYSDHKIYVATDKGVIIYNTNTTAPVITSPNIIIQSVKLLPASTNAGSSTVNNGAKLSYNNSHLSISFRGIYLKDPEGIYYRYKLTGLDTSFSAPVKNNVLDYPKLPAGNYVFQVRAYTESGVESTNTAKFSFSIIPPFYQTLPFRIAAILFLVLTGILIQAYRHKVKSRRVAIIETIRREENIKVRQEAAEDFHDDLGNKLTRISVLSDMLFTKIDPEKIDQKKLLEQIKQNALMLYTGTKDILWAMDSQSDNLYEVMNYIREFGVDLFIGTPLKFELIGMEQSLSQVKLPIKFNRNIILIFKEILNNALKHSNAGQVSICLSLPKKSELHVLAKDDGKGFDLNTIKKGQGINNIIMRTKRIGGIIDIRSAEGAGTEIILEFKLNTV